jgi:hypothetical protein
MFRKTKDSASVSPDPFKDTVTIHEGMFPNRKGGFIATQKLAIDVNVEVVKRSDHIPLIR